MNRFTGLTLVFLLCTVSASFAQEDESNSYISKGQWMLGGTMSLSTSDDFIRKPSFSISPMAGYFIGKRWALGLEVEYSLLEMTYFSPDFGDPIIGDNSYMLGRLSVIPFARYYFGVGKFAPFVEGGYGMNWYHSGEGIESYDNKTYKIGAGLNYFVTPSLAVEGKLLYSRSSSETAMLNPISLGIGLQFFLSRNQKGILKETETTFLEKGSWMIGGSMNVSVSDNEYSDKLYQNHRITPMAGYFLSDKLAMGLAMYYSYLGNDNSQTESFFAAPFARYYFRTKRFAPFAEAAFGAGVAKVEYFDGVEQQVSSDDDYSFQAAAGFNYFLTNSVALETKLSYGKSKSADQGTLGLQAGVSFFLSRKK